MSENFSNTERGPVVRTAQSKSRITIRLDAEVIEHFKAGARRGRWELPNADQRRITGTYQGA